MDNIDDALARHAGNDLYLGPSQVGPQTGARAYGIWLAGQLGFVLAVRELTAINSHLKLFGTVRSEAIRENSTATAFNAKAMILEMHYTPAQLRGIFAAKLERLHQSSSDSFARPRLQDRIHAFFPGEFIEHETVKDSLGNGLEEDIFEYLRRHTRGRPRELDFIGQELQMIPPQCRTPERIRDVIRALSTDFFKFARNEAVPHWNPDLDVILRQVRTNFISRKKGLLIARRAFGQCDPNESWRALFANGLCGAVVNAYGRGEVQRFSNHDGVEALSWPEFCVATTWVLHPCVNIATRASRDKYQPNGINVAGHACPYVSGKHAKKKHTHVLIGAGRLGLGLVVPALLEDEQTRVLVVARASSAWIDLGGGAGHGRIQLEVHHAGTYERASRKTGHDCRVVRDTDHRWQDTVRKGLVQVRLVLLIAGSDGAFQWAMSIGDSIGICVGNDGVDQVTTRICSAAPRSRTVIAYENDESTLIRVGAAVGISGRTLVPTVVDRICTERTIGSDSIVVRAEEYGTIVALVDRDRRACLPPGFVDPELLRLMAVSSTNEFAFIRERKKRLVNSLHAAAAALVRRALMDVGASPATARENLLPLIADTMEIRTQLVGVKELMILAVLGTLPEARRSGSALADIVRDLNAYGDEALRRILEHPDTPARVLREDVRSLSAKYDRLFGDITPLIGEALRSKEVRVLFPLAEGDIAKRKLPIDEAFVRLLAHAARIQGAASA